MPIEHTDGGVIFTGDSIDFFKLCTQRAAVDLELRGIKVYRSRIALWRALRDHYKIPGKGKRKATRWDVLKWLNDEVERLRPLQEHIRG